MKPAKISAAIPPDRRIVAMSDGHGNLAYLRGVLEKVRIRPDDIFVFIGDMVEKGPDSLGTLREIMALSRTHTVYSLAGNVDIWRMDLFDNGPIDKLLAQIQFLCRVWGSSLVTEMAAEAGVPIDTPDELAAACPLLAERFAAEWAFLRDAPDVLETQDYIFVHGGLPDKPFDEIDNRYDVLSVYPYFSVAPVRPPDAKIHVVGHIPVTLYNDRYPSSNPVFHAEKRILSIDGGCQLKHDGQLNAVLLEHGGWSWVSFDGFPTAIALDAQEASRDSVNLRWSDRWVNLLERGGDAAYVEHCSSGRRFWVPAGYIRQEKGSTDPRTTPMPPGAMACEDCTDYALPVTPGDALTVVLPTSKGTLCKKDGVNGWYTGRFAE
jgi:protein phosphatase